MNWKIGDLVYVRKDVIAETKEAQEVLKQEPGVGMIISITPLALTAKLLDDALNGPDCQARCVRGVPYVFKMCAIS